MAQRGHGAAFLHCCCFFQHWPCCPQNKASFKQNHFGFARTNRVCARWRILLLCARLDLGLPSRSRCQQQQLCVWVNSACSAVLVPAGAESCPCWEPSLPDLGAQRGHLPAVFAALLWESCHQLPKDHLLPPIHGFSGSGQPENPFRVLALCSAKGFYFPSLGEGEQQGQRAAS